MTLPHIVVVDRDPHLLALLTELLVAECFRVSTATDGLTALTLIATQPPALILLDIHLIEPGDGIALLQKLGTTPATVRIPVLLCSAEATFLTQHADDLPTRGYPVIAKPFDLDELVGRIRSLLLCPSTRSTR